jgi:hypothetical protein
MKKRLLTLAVAWAAMAGCGGGTPADPCPGGICPRVDSGLDAQATVDTGLPPADTGPPIDTGVLPVDTGVLPVDTGVPPSDAGCGGTCVERWSCTAWQTAGSGSSAATRTCTDLAACGTTCSRPAVTATLPALDRAYFECNVFPIWARSCGMMGCHGAEWSPTTPRALRIYARGRHRHAGETWIEPGCLSAGTPRPSDACEGSIECYCWTLPLSATEWQSNFDAARGFGLDANGVPLASPATSELLTQPLIGGGLTHAGVHFWRTTDPDYATIQSWLSGATLGHACTTGD